MICNFKDKIVLVFIQEGNFPKASLKHYKYFLMQQRIYKMLFQATPNPGKSIN